MDADQACGPLSTTSADETGPEIGTAGADSDLQLTLATRMHCRRPMQIVDGSEPSLALPVAVDAQAGLEALNTQSPAAGTLTYRCPCGFTMDVPPRLAATA